MKILKKYPNRKIYDSTERRYVTVRDIGEMVKQYEAVQVVDSKTGDDITRSILLQIISDLEDDGKNTLLTNFVLENLIRMYDDQMGGMLAAYLDYSLKSFLDQQGEFKQQFDGYMQTTQQENLADFNKQYMDYWKSLYSSTPPNESS